MNKKHFLSLLVGSIFFLALVLRFYNLNWGAPFYFHPDERNIASSISQLRFPKQLNPHFFAYGTFPIYTIYITAVAWNKIQALLTGSFTQSIFTVSFEQAIIISRLYSASLSLFVLIFIYKISKEVASKRVALLSLLLGATSVGFVQYAHFGTFEMWLTLFTILLLYFLIRWIQIRNYKYFLFSAVTFGLLMSIKVSSIVLGGLFLFALLYVQKMKYLHHGYLIRIIKRVVFIEWHLLMLLVVGAAVYIITSPYVIFDFTSFKASMQYESSVALGTLPVFYTGGFYNSIPIAYHLLYIYPFILTPLFTILIIPAALYVIYNGIKVKNILLLFIFFTFFLTFFSQVFLFVKWTRYMIPTLPVIYIMLSVFYHNLSVKFLTRTSLYVVVTGFIGFLTFLHLFSYAYTTLFQEDTRVEAVSFARKHIPKTARITSEVYDLGITPFNPHFSSITLFNFYDLDILPLKKDELEELLANTDYIILPSQRLVQSRFMHQSKFPVTYSFYKSLLDREEGFQQIYKTECDVFCKIVYLGGPLFHVEESTNVFDRPTLFVFKKLIKNGKTE